MSDRGARPLPAVARGRAPLSSLSARGPRRAAFPRKGDDGVGRLEPAVRRHDRESSLQGRRQVARHRADAQSVAGPLRRKAQGRRRGVGAYLQGEHPGLRADHQHARQGQGDFRPLARLRRYRRRSAPLQPGRARSGRRAGRGRARRLSEAVASLLRAQGALVRQEEAAPLGSQRAAAASADPHRRLDRGAQHRAHRLWCVLAEDGRHRRALLRRALDRCAGAPRQGAGRLRASDHAVGAPLRAAQLSGQAARRDDARARAGPRRASGAGGAQRRADGADPADARRDRERVRRDADLPRTCSPPPATRKSARRCSPPRSRT